MTATIECCNLQHKPFAMTYLQPQTTKFKYDILFEANCSNCKKKFGNGDLMAYCHVYAKDETSTKITKIARKEHPNWLTRKKIETIDNGQKDLRFIIFASQGTLEMCKDISFRPIKFKPLYDGRTINMEPVKALI